MRINVELNTQSDTLRISIEPESWLPSSEPNQSVFPHSPPEHGLRLIAVEGRIVERPVLTRAASPDQQIDHHWEGFSY